MPYVELLPSATEPIAKYAWIFKGASGDNALVAAVTGKKIRVLSITLTSAGTVNARLEDGAGTGTYIAGPYHFVANSSLVLPYNAKGWFETSAATGLNMELTAAINIGGNMSYIEV